MPSTRIVIIEDQIMVRDMIRRTIEDMPGMEVVGVATTLGDGFSVCIDRQPSLVLVSGTLPDGTGIELARKLKPILAETRLLLLSASEHPDLVKDAASVGVQGFVSKRHPLSILQNALQALAAGKHYYCPTSYRILLGALNKEETNHSFRLTERDWLLLRAVGSGMSTKQIAAQFKVTPKTVCNHIGLLKEKLDISETSGLVLYALRHGLITIQ